MYYLTGWWYGSAETFFFWFFGGLFFIWVWESEQLFKVNKIRPDYDFAEEVEIESISHFSSLHAYYDEYQDELERMGVTDEVFLYPDVIEEAYEKLEKLAANQKNRHELQKFFDEELTRRWTRIFEYNYETPQSAWYS